MIKIIGGEFKRKNLEIPLNNVRPTSSMKRESIFSIIESYAYKNSFNLYKNKAVLDWPILGMAKSCRNNAIA